MIARHEIDRDPAGRRLDKRRHCRFDGFRRHLAAKEQIATVHHQIDLSFERRLESPAKVGEKIGAPPSPGDPRLSRQVETNVGVGNEKNSHIERLLNY